MARATIVDISGSNGQLFDKRRVSIGANMRFELCTAFRDGVLNIV
jgi:hypothetical protein